MPLEITAIDVNEEDTNSYDAYTVYVGDHRILTLYTDCSKLTSKWFKGEQKSPNNNNKPGCLLVGVSVCWNSDLFRYDTKLHRYPDLEKTPYHFIQVCTGSHCFIHRLPDPKQTSCSKALKEFFADPRVISVGMDMRSVAAKFEAHHGIKFANPVDLNALAVKGIKRSDDDDYDLDLRRCDLDMLAKVVLGKHWDVDRPEREIMWFYKWRSDDWYDRYEYLSLDKAKELTPDPFLCYMIGSQLLNNMDDDKWYPKEFKEFTKKKKKNKKKF